jgi:hypothetical protein
VLGDSRTDERSRGAGELQSKGISVTLYAHGIIARKGRALVEVVPIDAFSPALTLNEETTLLRRMVPPAP